MNLLFHPDKQCRLILNYDWKISYFDENIANSFLNLYKKEIKAGIYLNDFIDIPLVPFFKESFQAALDGDSVHRKKMIEFKSSEKWFQFSFFPLWDGKKKVSQVLYLAEDVTNSFINEKRIAKEEQERFEKEEYLKKSEDKLRSLMESSSNLIFTLDKDFRFTYSNYFAFGLKNHEVIGVGFLQFIQQKDSQRISKYLNDCFYKGIVREFEIKGIVNGKLTDWFSNRIAPIRNNLTNEIEGIIGIASEISERKLIENQLQESKERFRTMADNAPVLIWIAGKDTQCNFFNKPWLEFTGRSMEEEIGIGWTNGVHPDDLDSCLKNYIDSFQERKSFEIEYRLKRHDGNYRWLLDRGIPLTTSSNEFSGYIGSCIDITERKQIESDMMASLEEKEILLKEIHHRVKNNLQIISSLLSLQSNQLVDPRIIEIFQANINRVKSISLLHDMLNQSQVRSKINFKDYLKLITNYLFMIHESSMQRVKLIFELQEIIISIDFALYIGLMVNELVSNSLKHAFPNGRIGEISVQASLDSRNVIILIINDNGIGVPSNFEIKHVKSLGLKLVSLLTNQMNGDLSIEKKTGLKFRISLPIDQGKNNGK